MPIIYTCPDCGGDLEEMVETRPPYNHRMVCNNCNWVSRKLNSFAEKVIRIPYYSDHDEDDEDKTEDTKEDAKEDEEDLPIIKRVTQVPKDKLLPHEINDPALYPYDGFDYHSNDLPDPCKACPNNIKNGGSGICHCILGSRIFYCTDTGVPNTATSIPAVQTTSTYSYRKG